MASEMPVLPLVGSRMRWPGSSSPDSSAASTIESATRSLTDPVGFCSSSLAKMRTPGLGLIRSSSRTVPPVASTSRAPPTACRRMGGMRTVDILGNGLLDRGHGLRRASRCGAELFVIDELDLVRILAADRAFGVAMHAQLDELHGQGVVA